MTVTATLAQAIPARQNMQANNVDPGIARRSPFWAAFAWPQQICHPDWRDQLGTWPEAHRLTRQTFEAPEALAQLFAQDRSGFDLMLLGAGLSWFSPAIRRVISGSERASLAALLGPEVLSAVMNLEPDRLVPGNVGAGKTAALARDGLPAVLAAGIALLAGCTQCYGPAWSHGLKIRVTGSAAPIIDHSVALNRQAADQRLTWFSTQLPALTSLQAIRALAARFTDESSVN